MQRFDPLESLAASRHEFGEHGGVNMSVEASTTFTVMDASTMPEVFQGRFGPERGGCYLYGRHFNPTVFALGKQMAAMEGAQAAYCTASGMSAISATVMQICNAGDHMVSSHTIYGGTFALFKEYLPKKTGIRTSFVDMTDLEAVEQAFTDSTRLLYVESISNPTLRVADIPRLAQLAHDKRVPLVVDNTFCPLILSPLQLGADIVVHSITKFINGASDVIAGAICASEDFIGQLMGLNEGSLMLLGPTMDPHVASSISLRIPHLGLRMAEHCRRASVFATRLQDLGLPVIYPGLPDHPDSGLLTSMANPGFGVCGILALDLKDLKRANRFMDLLQNTGRFGLMAVSLGYFETLLCCSASSTSSELNSAEQKRAGILPGLVRMSVGYTGSLEQRWGQLEAAIAQMGPWARAPEKGA